MTDKMFCLKFASGFGGAQLIEVNFRSTGDLDTRKSVRGKDSGAFRGAGTFQWTTAVRGLCSTAIRAILYSKGRLEAPILAGEKDTLASSLDYAISKEPAWLVEMFGVGPDGRALARKLFRISNSNRKRVGPVTLTLNDRQIPTELIRIVLDGRVVSDELELFEILQDIEEPEAAVRAFDCARAA